jgi:chromosome transmission fidelity protein 18
MEKNKIYFVEPENANSAPAQPIMSTQKPPSQLNVNTESLLASPALSQISRDDKLRFTPAALNYKASKKTSTPFVEKIGKKTQGNHMKSALSEIQNNEIKHKRKLEMLFGDNFDYEDEEDNFNLYSKKQKTDEQKDLETIEKILQLRRDYESVENPMKKSSYDRYEALFKFKKENISKVIPKYPFQKLIQHNDDHLYIRYYSEDFENEKINELKSYDKIHKGFFGTTKEQLWKEANDILLKTVEGSSQAKERPEKTETHQHKSNVDLWVEKYSPKKYLELLSEESINRSLLQWIKLWDKIVFNREVKKVIVKQSELSNFNKKTGRFEQNGGWYKRRKAHGNLNTELDVNNIPIQKVALLVGKPGAGKTTLAHIIAKHAGYVVREVNASDDRQLDSFKQILENCTQVTSVLNRDNRPNCIILDEIDGAPIASVEYLVRFALGQVKKSKKAKKYLLNRPIICICNDLYCANLRPLRQIAYVINFNSIDNTRLAERLLHISMRERIQTDLTTLLCLAEKTGGDIRSCISMIQFCSSVKKPLTIIDILKSNIGQKDQHKTLFNVWASIFQIQRPKKVLKMNNQDQETVGITDMSITNRMSHVLETVNSCGEYER